MTKMATIPGMLGLSALLLFVVFMQVGGNTTRTNNAELQYCSFFNNRAPKAQPGLKNCTWFKDNSCCMQQEIAATFGRVKPLKGASPACLKYINYLMCYICAPNQNLFYRNERLIVCEVFCSALYEACGSAILKGSVIGDLYPNGTDFCVSRSFNVSRGADCFTFDVSLDTSAGASLRPFLPLLAAALCFLVLLPNSATSSSNTTTAPPPPRKRRRIIIKRSHWRDCLLRVMVLILANHCILVTTIEDLPKLTPEDVSLWTNQISEHLNQIAEEGLKYREIQKIYNEAQYETLYVNGTAKVLEVREKLGSYFTTKKKLVGRLAAEVQRLHDEWYQRKQDVIIVSPPTHLRQLDKEFYRDADLPHTLPRKHLNYSKDFRRDVMESSSVKIPDDVPRDDKDIIETVVWSAKLDATFKRNRKEDPTLRWQYFGSSSGVYRSFPGTEWTTNFIGFHEDYDPRTRPWYVTATSGPKDIVMVLDGSISMERFGSLARLKNVARHILNTLTKQDRVSVVVSRSSYWTRNGRRVTHSPEILGCHQNKMALAASAHRRELIDQINGFVPTGGSDHKDAFKLAFKMLHHNDEREDNCKKLIVFITDGLKQDPDICCSPGTYRYDEENQKHFVPGEKCWYDANDVLEVVAQEQFYLTQQAHLFTFTTLEESTWGGYSLPGLLACRNHGAMAIVSSETDTFRQMAPYFTYLAQSLEANWDTPVWSMPYMDRGGLGLMVTLAQTVYSRTSQKHLGVVGVDVPLSHLETMLRHELWGTAYAFLIDRHDGEAIVHPLSKPSAQLLEDPVFIPVYELETHQGRPKQFVSVVRAMAEQQTGQVKITQDAHRAVTVYNSLIWRPIEYSNYFFSSIPDSDYAFAFNLAQSDEIYHYTRDPIGLTHRSYLHQMMQYANLTDEIPDAFEELKPTSNLALYPGLSVSLRHSVVHLAPRCFCDPHKFLEEGIPSLLDIDEYINTFIPTYDIPCPGGTYRTDVRPDVKLTAQLETFWLDRANRLQDKVAWTYMGTMAGVMRIYPGVELSADYDPTRRPWFNRAQVNHGTLVVSGVYHDAVPGVGKVVTLARAIHKAKPLTAPDCAGELRDYGCPCSTNHQCKSEYCDQKSCADNVIQGIVALDLRYEDFHSDIMWLVRESSIEKYCSRKYDCDDHSTCETKCYIVDDAGNIVFDAEYVYLKDSETSKYEGVSLATKEGHIFSKLLQLGLFEKQLRTDYQGICRFDQQDGENPDVTDPFVQNRDIPQQKRGKRGPIQSFQNYYGCIKEVVYYSTNKTFLREHGQEVISGDLSYNPCTDGQYFFMPIKKTNLYLLAIENNRDLNNPLNVNCYITNRVFRPGSFAMPYHSCSQQGGSLHHFLPRNCAPEPNITLPCGYSSSTRVISWQLQTHFIILWIFSSICINSYDVN